MINLFEKYNISILKKDVKNFILRIKDNSEIFLSVPLSAKDEDIDNFLKRRIDWIEQQLNKFNYIKKYNNVNIFCDGGEVRILGRQYKISVKLANQNNIFIYDNSLIIETNNVNNIKKQYENYYKKEAIKFFNKSSRKNNTILLNYYLYTTPIACIDYVILHELAHSIYYNHNSDFYLFLSFYMPDWKERKKELDYNYCRYF